MKTVRTDHRQKKRAHHADPALVVGVAGPVVAPGRRVVPVEPGRVVQVALALVVDRVGPGRVAAAAIAAPVAAQAEAHLAVTAQATTAATVPAHARAAVAASAAVRVSAQLWSVPFAGLSCLHT